MRKLLLILFISFISLKAGAVTITSFAPIIGSAGTLVTIKGSGLNNPTSFKIGGVTAIVISNTGSTLVGMVMPGATTGAVSVTTATGTANGAINFTVTSTTYVPYQQVGSKMVAGDYKGTSYQGSAVAVSADGNTAVVGGDVDDNYMGAAWIYTRNGNTWIQQGPKLVGTGYTGRVGQQGASVAISADGNTVMVGAPHDAVNIGAAWVFTRTGTTWTQQGNKLVGTGHGPICGQGTSVALSADGNTAMIGGPLEGGDIGAIWVFTRNANTWAQQGNKLTVSDNIGLTDLGRSVALSADGNTAIAGGYYDNNYIGAAWLFTRSGNTWVQQGNKLVGTFAGINPYQVQGTAVALSADGHTAIVGGTSNSTYFGGAWIYTRTGNTWTQQGQQLSQQFQGAWEGISVSLSADGNTALIGGHVLNNYEGAAWIYTRSNGNWALQQQINATDTIGAAEQGISVSLSANGTTALIGGSGDFNLTGAAWAFTGPVLTPVATTLAATLVGANSAVLNGTVDDGGSVTAVTIEYSVNADLSGSIIAPLTTGSSPMAPGTGTVPFSSTLNGLNQATTYYFRINGASNYGTDNGAIFSFTTLLPQAINFPPVATVTYGCADIMAGATSTNSGIPISYSSSNTSIATTGASGNIHITGAGTVTVTVSQAGDQIYSPAASVSRTFTVLPAALTIKADDQTRVYGVADPIFTFTYTGLVNGDSAGNLAALPIATSAAVITSHPGNYTLSISGAVSPNYTITYVPATLTITKAPQIISFDPIPVQRIGSHRTTVNITVNSGLPLVISSSSPLVATISGSVVTFNGTGHTTITASQAGDIDYLPASSSQLLEIVPPPVMPTAFTPNGDGINDSWNIKYIEGYADCTVNIYNRNGQLVYSAIGYAVPWDGRYHNNLLPAGTYYYLIDLKGNSGTMSGAVTLIR
ncbi:gliding motility-associated C-terminal domain-containing protein [Mucilaginibacter sp. AW1-3]